MGKLTRGACILASSLAAASAGPVLAADPSVDTFEAAQAAAWNAHDATAYTAAFAPDASVVTALGWHWSGQAEAARNLADGFKFVYANARLALSDVQVRGLSPELALVTLNWSIAGARSVESGQASAQHGVETQLLQRRADGWSILSQQDTPVAAPAPASPQYPQTQAPPATSFPTTPPPVRRCIVARGNGDCLIYGKAKPAT